MAATKTKTAKATATISVDLDTVSEKKSVVRFDVSSDVENPAMTTAYVSKEALKALGGAADGIRITIEAL